MFAQLFFIISSTLLLGACSAHYTDDISLTSVPEAPQWSISADE